MAEAHSIRTGRSYGQAEVRESRTDAKVPTPAEIAAHLGTAVSHAMEQPEPRQATAEEASLLGISGC